MAAAQAADGSSLMMYVADVSWLTVHWKILLVASAATCNLSDLQNWKLTQLVMRVVINYFITNRAQYQ